MNCKYTRDTHSGRSSASLEEESTGGVERHAWQIVASMLCHARGLDLLGEAGLIILYPSSLEVGWRMEEDEVRGLGVKLRGLCPTSGRLAGANLPPNSRFSIEQLCTESRKRAYSDD